MEEFQHKKNNEKKEKEFKTFSVPFDIVQNNINITFPNHKFSTLSEEQIINQAIKFHLDGNLSQASICYKHCINKGVKDPRVFSNFACILKGLRKLKEAELYLKKAIELKPDFADAFSNLGIVSKGLGKLKEAELYLKKAIELKPDFPSAYYSLSNLKYSKDDQKWQDKLFSKSILNNKSKKAKIEIFFARSNILHQNKKHNESSLYLGLANQIKLSIKPSNADGLICKSKELLVEFNRQKTNTKHHQRSHHSIFIVGMPRSGSTLVESILSMNPNVDDLGEINILEKSFLESKKVGQKLTLAEIYWKGIDNYKKTSNITTDKWLDNYQYGGIVLKQIPNSIFIHCFRNPLDNILSIYRAHFSKLNEYASSLIDCTRVYINQDELMTEYKKHFRSKIYDLDYDLLVNDPKKEIKSLIAWLGWKWDDSYLSPHLNTRSISTASKVQVRSPINSKSLGGWKNYRDMLKPAIEVLAKNDRYLDLIS
ncbi:Hypothetical protein NATL1_15821 [Prochlorococcus marinus str. NATL1A]|uniref:Uncharacterized protein n=1 Tax=Prochlorococcus marinus (strain NATL1A) TaxID=167555 RepID=A2C3S9_PROM1|nr:sulfotransferase [Prochlorococcus marinus]ABM76139.1 Hypothetical protein NATL1_15821 [Prochlorococcus marinus str. NATL1A]